MEQRARASLTREDENLQGEISLFCSVTASYSFLYDLLSVFRRKHPRIEIELHTGDTATAIERILREQEEIGLAAIPERVPSNLAVQTITQWWRTAPCGSALAFTTSSPRWSPLPSACVY